MNSRPKILCTDTECRFLEDDLHRLRAVADVSFAPSNDVDTLVALVPDADLLVTSCFPSMPKDVIDAGSRLCGIVKFGVGVDNISLDAAARRGIPVANCPDYSSGTMADHAFAMLLSLAHQLPRVRERFRRSGWFWAEKDYIGTDLEGKTLGVIGLGRIGRKMAQRSIGFDMRLLVNDPYVDHAEVAEAPFDAKFVLLDQLLAESDFVSIHCILTDETRGLIGEPELRAMKPSALLIDVSRGAIIDEGALVRALREGWIAGAGLDVFEEEPLPKDHPLLAIDNVIATPHMAWYTTEADLALSNQATEVVLDMLAGRRPPSVVNGVWPGVNTNRISAAHH